MNKIFKSALVAILSIYSTHVFAEGTTINYRLASADETRKLMQGNTEYYAKMNQMDIDWRVRKEGSTLAELQTMAWQQTRDWTDAEREFMATIVGMITDSLNSIGCQLPVPSEIVFAKTTQAEEGGSAGYTIKNIIFLNETYLGMCLPNAERTAEISSLVVVFPLVPVMPITGISNCLRCSLANSLKVVKQSSTNKYRESFSTMYSFSSIIA